MVFFSWATEVTDGLHRVTGALTPDGTGDYLPHIIHEGKMSYRREDGGFFIWWDPDVDWIISVVLGEFGVSRWTRTDPNIEGLYLPAGAAVGNATVTEI